jgi:DNA-binding response OmpR family regulator
MILESMTVLLECEGFEVSTAADGEQALDRLRGPVPPALVVLDLMLPVMDGFEFRVRQMLDPAIAMIPVIVCSGGGDLEQKAAGLGAAACLRKPIDLDELVRLIGSCVVAREVDA